MGYQVNDDDEDVLADSRNPNEIPRPLDRPYPVTAMPATASITGAASQPRQTMPAPSITAPTQQPLDMPSVKGPLDVTVPPAAPPSGPLGVNDPKYQALAPHGLKKVGLEFASGLNGGLLGGFGDMARKSLNAPTIAYNADVLGQKNQLDQEKSAADVLHTGAETNELGSEQGLQAAETAKNQAETATAGKGTWKPIPETNSEQNDITGETRQMQGVTPLPARTLPEQNMPLNPQQIDQLNKQFTDRWQALNPKKPIPAEFNLQPGATIGDYSRVSDSLKSAEGISGTQAQRAQTNEEAQQRLGMAENPSGTAFNRVLGENAAKDVQTAQGADFRFRSMNDSYPKALNGDQQAMLNLLANHIGMTMGLQKGARITQSLLNEAVNSTPWLQHVEASFDRNGYLSGVKLTPMQMGQMMELAKDQRSNAWQQAHDSADQAGVLDKVKIPDDTKNPNGGGTTAGTGVSSTASDQRPPDKPGFKTQSKMVDGKKVYRQVPIGE